jgi:hypothetical protein
MRGWEKIKCKARIWRLSIRAPTFFDWSRLPTETLFLPFSFPTFPLHNDFSWNLYQATLRHICNNQSLNNESQKHARANMLLFMSMGSGVSELQPPTGLLFIPTWYTNMKSHGGMILTGENRRTRRKTCPNATLFTKFPNVLSRPSR